MLLREIENETRCRVMEGLWLHLDERNSGAHRFYERNGWTHHNTINPAWKEGRATRIYVKELSRLHNITVNLAYVPVHKTGGGFSILKNAKARQPAYTNCVLKDRVFRRSHGRLIEYGVSLGNWY
jgi:hypothetical protein